MQNSTNTGLGAACFIATSVCVAVAQTTPQAPYPPQTFNPAHGDLARSAGVPAELANKEYVTALGRLV
jgi:hypothetical protein